MREIVLPCNRPDSENIVVIGEVVAVHIDDAMLADGMFDLTRHQPVARCGYRDYAVVREVFQMNRPGQG